MTNSDLVVMTCTSCQRKVRTSAARQKLGLCTECERSGNLSLPEPTVETDEDETESIEELFVFERKAAVFLSYLSIVAGFLSAIVLSVGFLAMIAPGGPSPVVVGSIGGGGIMLSVIGWLLSSLLRVEIAIVNSRQTAA